MEMQGTPPCFIERYFKIREKGSTVRTELLAGMTTFIAMAYILFVNPNILADAGIPKDAAIASTIWIAALASMAMGVFANYPVALAPGMGLNAFFAYYVCGVLGLHWTVALGAVFFSGVLFLILTADFFEGMYDFDRQIPGFAGEDCYVAGVESRTSSPVRITRDAAGESLLKGLYPCGEGAGYAGGIMSAAMDGLKAAETLARCWRPQEGISNDSK